jgi:hypothetical protein
MTLIYLTMDFLTYNDSYKNFKCVSRFLSSDILSEVIHDLPSTFKVKQEGLSVLGKPILSVRWGEGSTKVLAWSQMHGNESTTTKALFDLFNFLQKNEKSTQWYNKFTFLFVPMLNTDGSSVYTRVNANQIDINRDFQLQSQPETKVLLKLCKEFSPDLALNLHDQRSIFGLEQLLIPATLSFLAPAADVQRSFSASRAKAAHLIGVMYRALKSKLNNQIGRFDDTFNPECVGDTFQAMGIPTILFEAGHFQNDYQREQTRFFVFLAFLELFSYIYENDIVRNENDVYLNIYQNKSSFFDFVYRNVKINYENSFLITNFAAHYEEVLHQDKVHFIAKISKIGDLQGYKGHFEFDAANRKFDSAYGKMPILDKIADFTLGNDVKIVNGLVKHQ